MKTIQITIDECLLQLIDREIEARNRSAFFRQAAELLLGHLETRRLESAHQDGYRRHPVLADEFATRELDQVWPE